MKKIIVIVMALVLTSMSFSTAFAGTGEQKVSISTENFAHRVVGGEQIQEMEVKTEPLSIFPVIATFQVKRVRLYPVYEKPEEPGVLYYDKNIYVINTIPGNDWGQVNVLYVSPATTEKLLHTFDGSGYVVKYWRMEMDCYVANYERPYRFEFVSLDGSTTRTSYAYNGTQTFVLSFPVQATTAEYSNGYKGSFSYYNTSGNLMKAMAGGYAYLNSRQTGAK